MSTSLNGWPVLDNHTTGPQPHLRKWSVPLVGTNTPKAEDRHLFLRDGSAGFLLVHMATWWHDAVERLDLGVWDEWGWSPRPPRGQVNGWSNHASGTAVDLNATRHPHHVPIVRTFTPHQISAIRRRLRVYGGMVDWGGDWSAANVDGMHLEIRPGATLAKVESVARRLITSPRGESVLEKNPGAKAVILS